MAWSILSRFMDQILHGLLIVGAIEALVALIVVLVVRAKNRRTTGVALHHRCGPRRRRPVVVAFLALQLVFALFVGGVELWILCVLLVATGACLWLQPSPRDEVCGADGVQYGWRSRRFEDLEEWRLTGEHLRFRVAGTWLAVGVPSAEHAALRKSLEELCPDRESRFSR